MLSLQPYPTNRLALARKRILSSRRQALSTRHLLLPNCHNHLFHSSNPALTVSNLSYLLRHWTLPKKHLFQREALLRTQLRELYAISVGSRWHWWARITSFQLFGIFRVDIVALLNIFPLVLFNHFLLFMHLQFLKKDFWILVPAYLCRVWNSNRESLFRKKLQFRIQGMLTLLL